MKRIKKIITKNLTGKKILMLFFLTNLIFACMLLITFSKTMQFSNGMKPLDLMPWGYDSEYIHALFKALGTKGRDVYLYMQIPVDMIYPFLFGITYCLLMAYFLKKMDKLNSAFFYLSFLPIMAGLADYLENFGIINMLIHYPNQSQSSMDATNIFSIIKSMTMAVFFVALIITLVMLGIKTIKKRITNANTG